MILNNYIKIFFFISTLLLGVDCERELITIHMIGDSTMADKKGTIGENPERGWGQVFHQYFNEGVKVSNYAVNGRSTKSFISEGRWNTVLNNINEGDFVFIQFGHNDQKLKDPTRYTNPTGSYYHNLKKFVLESRSKGATPVLLTSIVRRNFNEYGTLVDTHGIYPLIVRQVARDLDVHFVDHLYLTENIVSELGPEKSKSIYLWVNPGIYEKFPDGKQDDTHLNIDGANLYAKLVAGEISKFDIELKNHIYIK